MAKLLILDGCCINLYLVRYIQPDGNILKIFFDNDFLFYHKNPDYDSTKAMAENIYEFWRSEDQYVLEITENEME